MASFVTPKKAMEWGGIALGLCGVVFVLAKATTYFDDIRATLSLSTSNWVILCLATAAFAALNLLLARGWFHILRGLDMCISFASALRIYAQSQLAKYIPGNVFQFVGRQALTVSAGYGNGPVAKSTLLELLMLIGLGALFAIPVLPILVFSVGPKIGLALLMVVLVPSIFMTHKYLGPEWLLSGISYFLFLLGTGIIFLIIFAAVFDGTLPWNTVTVLVCGYVVAWLAGLLTPGAPAGLGVREVVLIFLLSDLAQEPVVVAAVLVSRLVNIVGDFLFFLSAGLYKQKATP